LCAAYDGAGSAEERDRISKKLAERVSEWAGWAQVSGDLQYCFAKGQKKPCLLVRYDDPKTDNVGWYTLQSMRHVDKEITLEDAASGQANRS
jgi:hypothetical protein